MCVISAEPGCSVEVDLGFLLDASHSVQEHFEEEKDLLEKLAGDFHISDDETQVHDSNHSEIKRPNTGFNLKLTDFLPRNCLLIHHF